MSSRPYARSKDVLGHSNIVRETPRRAVVSPAEACPMTKKPVRGLTALCSREGAKLWQKATSLMRLLTIHRTAAWRQGSIVLLHVHFKEGKEDKKHGECLPVLEYSARLAVSCR